LLGLGQIANIRACAAYLSMHLDAACSPDWGRLNRYVVHTKKTVSSYIASHACVLITNIKRSKSQKKFVILIVGK